MINLTTKDCGGHAIHKVACNENYITPIGLRYMYIKVDSTGYSNNYASYVWQLNANEECEHKMIDHVHYQTEINK